jgi:orotate phosphoribosyltransferase
MVRRNAQGPAIEGSAAGEAENEVLRQFDVSIPTTEVDCGRRQALGTAAAGSVCRPGRPAADRGSYVLPVKIRQPSEQASPAFMSSVGFSDKAVIAELTAKMLLEVNAVRFAEEKPFIYTSGLASPVYTDCRRLISFPRVRQTLMDFGAATMMRDVGFEAFDAIAGGETAGIPFAAWMADRFGLPMQYVRKKPKGFGRNAQIEGHLVEGQRTLLVEDLATDGGSKVNFCRALREAGARVEHVFVVFFYDIFPGSTAALGEMGITLHALATWWDVLAYAKSQRLFEPERLAEVERFMKDPRAWSLAHGGTAGAAESS